MDKPSYAMYLFETCGNRISIQSSGKRVVVGLTRHAISFQILKKKISVRLFLFTQPAQEERTLTDAHRGMQQDPHEINKSF